MSEEKEKTAAELEERERLAKQLEEEKKTLEEATSHLKGDLMVSTFELTSSLVPRPSQLFNASHFSVCNIEKLGGPGDEASHFLSFLDFTNYNIHCALNVNALVLTQQY